VYGLPDFDDRQRLTYLSLSGPELALASSRPGLHAQVWCTLLAPERSHRSGQVIRRERILPVVTAR
jgi:hypothetical protein